MIRLGHMRSFRFPQLGSYLGSARQTPGTLKTVVRGGALRAFSSVREIGAQAMSDELRFRVKEILRRHAG